MGIYVSVCVSVAQSCLVIYYIHCINSVGNICICVCSVAQSCPTLSDPMDCNLPGSSVHGISWQEYWSGLPFPPPKDLPIANTVMYETNVNTVKQLYSNKTFRKRKTSTKEGRRFPGGAGIKNPPEMLELQEAWVRSLDLEDTLKEEMAVHSSIPAWEIPRTKEPGGLQSMG